MFTLRARLISMAGQLSMDVLVRMGRFSYEEDSPGIVQEFTRIGMH